MICNAPFSLYHRDCQERLRAHLMDINDSGPVHWQRWKKINPHRSSSVGRSDACKNLKSAAQRYLRYVSLPLLLQPDMATASAAASSAIPPVSFLLPLRPPGSSTAASSLLSGYPSGREVPGALATRRFAYPGPRCRRRCRRRLRLRLRGLIKGSFFDPRFLFLPLFILVDPCG